MKSKEERRRIAKLIYEKMLTPEEFERRLALARTPEQQAERREQIEWFKRRYPTALERLRYVTRRARAWSRD